MCVCEFKCNFTINIMILKEQMICYEAVGLILRVKMKPAAYIKLHILLLFSFTLVSHSLAGNQKLHENNQKRPQGGRRNIPIYDIKWCASLFQHRSLILTLEGKRFQGLLIILLRDKIDVLINEFFSLVVSSGLLSIDSFELEK